MLRGPPSHWTEKGEVQRSYGVVGLRAQVDLCLRHLVGSQSHLYLGHLLPRTYRHEADLCRCVGRLRPHSVTLRNQATCRTTSLQCAISFRKVEI